MPGLSVGTKKVAAVERLLGSFSNDDGDVNKNGK